MIINQLLLPIFSFVFFSCNSRPGEVEEFPRKNLASGDTSIVHLSIEVISSNEFKRRFPQSKFITSSNGFTVFDNTDSTYYPNDAAIKFIGISADKSLYLVEKEGYMSFYLINEGKIYNDAYYIPDSLSAYKKGQTTFVESYFYQARPRIEIIQIDEFNDFSYIVIPLKTKEFLESQ